MGTKKTTPDTVFNVVFLLPRDWLGLQMGLELGWLFVSIRVFLVFTAVLDNNFIFINTYNLLARDEQVFAEQVFYAGWLYFILVN